jgi:hypothetical protein
MDRWVARFGLLITLIVFLVGCRPTATPPAPTPVFRFITVTPTTAGSAAAPTATGQAPAAPSPTPLPTPTRTPFVTPAPSPTPFNSPTPIIFTPTPSNPSAVINSPSGSLNVRRGPGRTYEPPLGTYDNGVQVEVLGKQTSAEGELWWLIPFAGSPTGQGWIFADYTIASNVDKVPWVTAPAPPTRVPVTRGPPPIPEARIDSPEGFVFVRRGPGEVYVPTLGTLGNNTVLDILGKQLSPSGELWWLIPYPPGPNGRGWIEAIDTDARYTEYVPWVPPPATPTPTPSVTTTPPTPSLVEWRITGRVIDDQTDQPVVGAFVGARLGTEGTTLSVTTDGNGQFLMVGTARDAGDLTLNIAAQGYIQRTVTAGSKSPRTYDFASLELTREAIPVVTWAIFGRVTELGTANAVSGAKVEAFLGIDEVRVETFTNASGEFAMQGQAPDQGSLRLEITAEGYQPTSFTSDQTDSRIYNLPSLDLVPQAGTCRYESVINLNQAPALARLQTLNFTTVSTQTVNAGGNPDLIGRVITQMPNPPPDGQSMRISCQEPITLGIGVEAATQ